MKKVLFAGMLALLCVFASPSALRAEVDVVPSPQGEEVSLGGIVGDPTGGTDNLSPEELAAHYGHGSKGEKGDRGPQGPAGRMVIRTVVEHGRACAAPLNMAAIRKGVLPSGPANNWAKSGVEYAKATGLWVGEPGYKGASDSSNRAFATNQRVANGLTRVYGKSRIYTDQRVGEVQAELVTYAQQDAAEHAVFRHNDSLVWPIGFICAFVVAAVVGLVVWALQD